MNRQAGKSSIYLEEPVYIRSSASIVGKKEGQGLKKSVRGAAPLPNKKLFKKEGKE